MKNYTVMSKVVWGSSSLLILLAVINGFTGFLNSAISLSGTLVCIMGCLNAIFATVMLEKQRQEKRR